MININRLNQNNNYSLENPKIPVKRSTLIMRETNQTTGDVGKIIPFFVHEMLPSETFKANVMAELQFTPFVTNLVHEIRGEIRTYFVPYRIIWDKWERFITGCDEETDEVDGTIIEELPRIDSFRLQQAIVLNIRDKFEKIRITEREQAIQQESEINKQDWIEEMEARGVRLTNQDKENYITKSINFFNQILELTTEQLGKPMYLSLADALCGWIPVNTEIGKYSKSVQSQTKVYKKYLIGTIYDYYGLPIQDNWANWVAQDIKYNNVGSKRVLMFMPNAVAEQDVSIISQDSAQRTNINAILNEQGVAQKPIALNFWAYNKIYNDWIRRMDWEPRVNKENLTTLWGSYENDMYTRARRYQLRGAMPTVPINIAGAMADGHIISQVQGDNTSQEFIQIHDQDGTVRIRSASQTGQTNGHVTINKVLQGEITGHGSWNILDMTTPAGILNYYLANARIKPRYAEQLLARWGVTIQDARFQYAQFVDSTRINVSQNGVTQTAPQSGESTAQGNITGQAWGNGGGNIRFYAPEHGVIISYIQITPANAYENGMKREYLKKTKFDYPTPELVDTPDVPLYKSELVINSIDNVEENELGYIAIYDEYRTKTNRVTGLLRPSIKGSLGAKTLARYFENDVNMETLLKCKPDMERIKQFTTQPDFILYTQTSIKTSLPLPYINDPRIMI